jgi:hypothetical protein
MDIKDRKLTVIGKSGRRLLFAIERIRDGTFHYADRRAWYNMQGRTMYVPLPEVSRRQYEAPLPALDPAEDYCLHVVDGEAQQVVAIQLIDGEARKLTTPRVGTRKGRPAPQNERHGDFVVDIRTGRQVELE